MGKIDTGGEAYPVNNHVIVYADKGCISKQDIKQVAELLANQPPSMTLLDYFVGQANIDASPDRISSESAENLTGRKEPNGDVKWYEFWADVKARLRYIEAAAMIAEKRRLEAE